MSFRDCPLRVFGSTHKAFLERPTACSQKYSQQISGGKRRGERHRDSHAYPQHISRVHQQQFFGCAKGRLPMEFSLQVFEPHYQKVEKDFERALFREAA